MGNEIEKIDLEGGQPLIEKGFTLQRTQNEFTTAIAIQKPRIRRQVIAACEEESALAGDEFYYSWTVKGETGAKLVEGLSIQAALSAARNWGNCAIPCRVEETDEAYIFTATFIDFETGFNLQRAFRQKKSKNIGQSKMKDSTRAEDIIFQIGQSKAIRNVALNALPSWLTSKMLEKAKENIIEKINKMGIAKAKEKTIAYLGRYNISLFQIESKLGKKSAAWTAEDLALLQGAMNTLTNGMESAESLFPSTEIQMPKSKSEQASIPKTTDETSELDKELLDIGKGVEL